MLFHTPKAELSNCVYAPEAVFIMLRPHVFVSVFFSHYNPKSKQNAAKVVFEIKKAVVKGETLKKPKQTGKHKTPKPTNQTKIVMETRGNNMYKSDGLSKRSILEVLKVLNTCASTCPQLPLSANLYYSKEEVFLWQCFHPPNRY